jgi:hypothetical protein
VLAIAAIKEQEATIETQQQKMKDREVRLAKLEQLLQTGQRE